MRPRYTAPKRERAGDISAIPAMSPARPRNQGLCTVTVVYFTQPGLASKGLEYADLAMYRWRHREPLADGAPGFPAPAPALGSIGVGTVHHLDPGLAGAVCVWRPQAVHVVVYLEPDAIRVRSHDDRAFAQRLRYGQAEALPPAVLYHGVGFPLRDVDEQFRYHPLVYREPPQAA